MLKNGKSLDFKRLSGMKKVHDNSINITVDLWRRARDFFRCTPVRLRVASLLDHVGKNSPPDCFLPQTSLLPPCSNPSFCLTNSPNFIRNYFMGVQLRFREVALLYRNHEIDLLPGIKIPLGIYPRWYDKRDLLVK